MQPNQQPNQPDAAKLMAKKRTIDPNTIRERLETLKGDKDKTQDGRSETEKKMAELNRAKATLKAMEEKKRQEKSAKEAEVNGKTGGVQQGDVKNPSVENDGKKGDQGFTTSIKEDSAKGSSGGNGQWGEPRGFATGSDDEDDDGYESDDHDDEIRYGQATGQGWL